MTLLLLLACAPAPDNARDKAAEAYCRHLDRDCNAVQEGEMETCVEVSQVAFEGYWSEDLCPEGLDNAAWQDCLAAIEAADCEDPSAAFPERIEPACEAAVTCPS